MDVPNYVLLRKKLLLYIKKGIVIDNSTWKVVIYCLEISETWKVKSDNFTGKTAGYLVKIMRKETFAYLRESCTIMLEWNCGLTAYFPAKEENLAG